MVDNLLRIVLSAVLLLVKKSGGQVLFSYARGEFVSRIVLKDLDNQNRKCASMSERDMKG